MDPACEVRVLGFGKVGGSEFYDTAQSELYVMRHQRSSRRLFFRQSSSNVVGSLLYTNFSPARQVYWACSLDAWHCHAGRVCIIKIERLELIIVQFKLIILLIISNFSFIKDSIRAHEKRASNWDWGCVMLILRRQNQRFETLIQNADPKRP